MCLHPWKWVCVASRDVGGSGGGGGRGKGELNLT